MKSYAAIDRIEGKFAVCEIELVPVEESANLTPFEKETKMLDISIDVISRVCGDIQESDIIVVEHEENSDEISVCGKDQDEKQRRIELLKKIMNS